MVVCICSSSWLLAVKSRDLSQTEKKITIAKAEQISGLTTVKAQIKVWSRDNRNMKNQFWAVGCGLGWAGL